MKLRNATVLVASSFFFIGVVPTAYALDDGERGTPKEISARLKAEHQQVVAHAHLMADDGSLRGMFFTASPDLKTGYIIQSDKPYGDPGTVFTVYKRLADVRVYDFRSRTPDEVFLKASVADSERKCGELAAAGKVHKDGCIPFNRTLRNGEQHGQRPMLQAFNVVKRAGGEFEPNGTFTTVTGNFLERDPTGANVTAGSVSSIYYSTLPEGATIINATLAYADYDPYGLELLKRK